MSNRTSFVGRQRALALLAQRLDDGGRLASVRGPAGIGKTRLARRFASDWEQVHRGPVWFCELETAGSVLDVLALVGAQLDLPLSSASDALTASDQLGRAMASHGPALLVLDDVDHLLDVVRPFVDRWMSTAPHARFVVTSRARLGVDGEQSIDVPPLEPEEAFVLFVDRARAVRADFSASADDPITTALLAELEGIPLAIELAAARLRVLGAKELLGHLDRRLDILGDAHPGAHVRKATLRGAIASSWDLLNERERQTLARCSVFRGGWSLDAGCAVAGGPSGDATRVIEDLTSLRDRSLLLVEAPRQLPHEARFKLYASVRAYAAEQLELSGERDMMQERHASWFADAGDRYARDAQGATAKEALARLELEADNLVEVHRWSVARAPELAARAALALEPLGRARGPALRTLALLDAAARQLDRSSNTPLRVRVSCASAGIRRLVGQLEEARQDLDLALGLARATGDATVEAYARAALGRLEADRGCLDSARAELEASLDLRASIEGLGADPEALLCLGWVHFLQNRFDDAQTWLERALEGFIAAGSIGGQASAHSNLGSLARRTRRIAASEHHLSRAVELAREATDRRLEVIAHANLGNALRDVGRLDEARRSYEAASSLAGRLGQTPLQAMVDTSLGLLDHAAGNLREARTRLFGALEMHKATKNLRFEALTRARLGILELEAQAIDDAAAHWRVATAIAHAKEPSVEALALVYAGVASFMEGRIGEVSPAFAQARRHHEMQPEPTIGALIAILEAFAELAAAMRAIEAADEDAAVTSLANARLRVERSARSSAHRFAEEIIAARIVGAAIERTTSKLAMLASTARESAGLELGPAARWFRMPGREVVELARHKALRLLLQRLAEARTTCPAEPVTVPDLVVAGWPEERIVASAGARRVYTAMSTLRRMGLRDILVRREDGYLLDPALVVIRR